MARDNGSTRSRWRQSRVMQQPPAETDRNIRPPPPPPPVDKVPKIKSKTSRLSLFSLFSSPNVEKARGHYEPGLAAPVRQRSPSPPASISRPPNRPVRSTPSATPQIAPIAEETQTLRGKIQKSAGPVRPSKQQNWSLPPLFQVFPQAIRHVKVDYSVNSTDALLKPQHRRTSSTLRDVGRTALEKAGPPVNAKRLSTTSLTQAAERTSKVFALTTSGFVVQYAGDGSSDRMPEKVLQLGPESVAYPSDVIPGKHWVLQISQSASDDGTIAAAQQKSLLSRFRSQNPRARRQAINLLLVLESAEDMDSWLSALRTQIGVLSGKEYKAHADSSSADPSLDLARKANHRTLEQDNGQQRALKSQQGQSRIDSMAASADGAGLESFILSDSESARSSRRPSVPQSLDLASPATTPVSAAAAQLNNLRDGGRLSNVSNGTSASAFTEATEQNSSPEISPVGETFFRFKDTTENSRNPTKLKSFAMNPNPSAAHWRRSMQLTLLPMDESSSLAEEFAEHDIPYTQDYQSPPAATNRPPRRRTYVSNEKRLSFRSASAPAPTIPLPPLPPNAQQAREKRHRPVSSVNHLIGGPPSLPPTIPLPQVPQSAKPNKPINFSRRQSTRDGARHSRIQQTKPVPLPSPLSSEHDSPAVSPQSSSPAGSPKVDTPPSVSSVDHVRGESPTLDVDLNIISDLPLININEPGGTKPAIPHRKRPSLASLTTPQPEEVVSKPPILSSLPIFSPLSISPDTTLPATTINTTTTSAATSASRASLPLPTAIPPPFIPRRTTSIRRPPPIPITVNPCPRTPQTHNKSNTPTFHRKHSLPTYSSHTSHAYPTSTTRPAAPLRRTSQPGPPPTTALSSLFSAPKVQSGYFRDNVLTDPARGQGAPKLLRGVTSPNLGAYGRFAYAGVRAPPSSPLGGGGAVRGVAVA